MTSLARVVSITNQKGGVAKTTSVANIGGSLALHQDKRVLLIDLDPQANLTSGLGIDWDHLDATIYDVLEGSAKARDVLIERSIEGAKYPIQLLPSSLSLSGAEIKLSAMYGRERLLREALQPVLADFDTVLIDCPPSLGLLTVNALVASDSFCIPVEPEYYAKRGVMQTLDAFSVVRKLNPELALQGAFITKYDKRRRIHQQSAEELGEFFGENLFRTKVRVDTNLSEAPQLGLTIFEHQAQTRGAKDYRSLTSEIFSDDHHG